MALTVADALKLPCMNDARLIAGEHGMGKIIASVSVSECPEFPLDLNIMGKYNLLFREAEFFITSGYAIKDEPKLLLDTIRLYSKYNSSGMCLSTRYFPEISPEVIQYCNEVNFPLISLKRESTVYSDLIMGIAQAILLNVGNTINETIVDELRDTQLSVRKIKVLAYKLNPAFQLHNHAICIFFDSTDKFKAINVLNHLQNSSTMFAMLYRNYLLIFFSSRTPISIDNVRKNVRYIKSVVVQYFPDCHMGISNAHDDVGQIRDMVEESIIACEVAKINQTIAEEYNKIGIYKFLMHLRGNMFLRRFYQEMLRPFDEVSEVKREELLNTMTLFVSCDGDIQRMARETFQHVNTIRYRVMKLKSILGMEDSELEFMSTVSVISKIRKILELDGERDEEESECVKS